MGSMDQANVDSISFGVHKKNARGRYQSRKLQFDFINQQLYNMEGDTDKQKRVFPFREICLIKRDQDNPLSFLVAFRDSTPFHIYARSKRDADVMVDTIEKIIENGKKNVDTQVHYQLLVLQKGYVQHKAQLGFQKRWLVLHKWQMVILRDEGDLHPFIIRSLYNVPLVKYTDTQENGQLSHFIGVLFDDDQFVFRFEAQEARDEWFAAFLTASQDERNLSTIPPEQLQLKTKSKSQMRIEQEVETVRAERMMVAGKDTDVKDERQRLIIVVDELKSRCAAAENEVQRLTMRITAMDDEHNRTQDSIKKHQANIKDDEAKKVELESAIAQLEEQKAEIKKEIEKADLVVQIKQNDVGHIDSMDDTEAVKRKRAVNSAFNEGEQKIAALRHEQQETRKKSELKSQRIQQLEKEIEDILLEVKSITTEKEAELESSSKKDKEQSEMLNMQKNTIASRVKEEEKEKQKHEEVQKTNTDEIAHGDPIEYAEDNERDDIGAEYAKDIKEEGDTEEHMGAEVAEDMRMGKEDAEYNMGAEEDKSENAEQNTRNDASAQVEAPIYDTKREVDEKEQKREDVEEEDEQSDSTDVESDATDLESERSEENEACSENDDTFLEDDATDLEDDATDLESESDYKEAENRNDEESENEEGELERSEDGEDEEEKFEDSEDEYEKIENGEDEFEKIENGEDEFEKIENGENEFEKTENVESENEHDGAEIDGSPTEEAPRQSEKEQRACAQHKEAVAPFVCCSCSCFLGPDNLKLFGDSCRKAIENHKAGNLQEALRWYKQSLLLCDSDLRLHATVLQLQVGFMDM